MYSCAVKRVISVSGPVPTGVGIGEGHRVLDLAPDVLGDNVDLGKRVDDAGIDVLQVEPDGMIVDHFDVLDLVPDVADVERLVLLEHVVGEFHVVAASKASPSDHLTPSRSVTVTLLRSSEKA